MDLGWTPYGTRVGRLYVRWVVDRGLAERDGEWKGLVAIGGDRDVDLALSATSENQNNFFHNFKSVL